MVGVKNKTGEVQSKIGNVILVDANKNQVRSPTLPQLPQNKELFKSLSPYHAKLVGESYLGRRRPVFECTNVQRLENLFGRLYTNFFYVQIEAAKGFLAVLRSYLDSLCSNLRSHTITNVQSNDDKVRTPPNTSSRKCVSVEGQYDSFLDFKIYLYFLGPPSVHVLSIGELFRSCGVIAHSLFIKLMSEW
ncbi:hypothetical protein IFM89_033240 [Coptis chinensis]|uniref:Uncharacterized protein n=1 Tax=Coptis chinensis TaxID=261450 RepID=A0A835IZU5_9MAGN|nr:hypothetical protein IFM89_033240 [Coptis chinensis]